MQTSFKAKAFKLVEINVNSNSSNVLQLSASSFDYMRRIVRIEAYSGSSITQSPSQRPVFNQFQNAYLTIVEKGTNRQILEDVPLLTLEKLNPTLSNANNGVLDLDISNIDWVKSFIKVPTSGTFNIGESILLGVYYEQDINQ